jgi:ferredoxin
MANVIFCGFGKEKDGLVKAKNGELILRVASANGVMIPKECEEGECGSCVVKVEELTDEKQTHYMEEKEVSKLIELGLLTKEKAEELNQSTTQSEYRLACQATIRGDILVKPYN